MSQQKPTLQGFFITGSDTGVGKTWVSCQIIHQLKSSISLKVRKPVESGCTTAPDNTRFAADGQALFAANDRREDALIVTPYRYSAALAPDAAARRENKTITMAQLQQAVRKNLQKQDFVIVEGAGGFYSPIAEDGLNADLAKQLGLDVIIVIEDRLGAINQGLLTIKAVESEGLKIKAIVLNQRSKHPPEGIDNRGELCARISYPVFSCPYQQQANDFQLLD